LSGDPFFKIKNIQGLYLIGNIMQIKGDSYYCFYCKKPLKKNKKLNDLKNIRNSCTSCSRELQKYGTEIAIIERRITNDIEKFLVNICKERKRSNPNNEKYIDIFLLKEKEEKSTDRKIITKLDILLDYTNIQKVKKNYITNITLFYSQNELLLVEKQQTSISEIFQYVLIGQIKLKEIFEILR